MSAAGTAPPRGSGAGREVTAAATGRVGVAAGRLVSGLSQPPEGISRPEAAGATCQRTYIFYVLLRSLSQ